MCIVTDGMENSSKEYTSDHVKKLIKECEKEHDWSFVYLAANQDAFNVGQSFGVSAGNTFNFTADSTGMENVSTTLTNAVSYYRNTTADSGDYANLMANFGEGDDNLNIATNENSGEFNVSGDTITFNGE